MTHPTPTTPTTPTTHSHRSHRSYTSYRSRATAILRALCGAPAGARRRGSTIVLVVSSLALFAMIAVAYVGLGIGDRRTGAVTVARGQVDDVVVKVRDYLVDVIGRDTIAVLVEPDGQGAHTIVREAWDYPWTDPNRVSTGAGIRFDPAGTMPRNMVQDPTTLAPFAGSDPWLASTEPTWLPQITSGGTLPTPQDPYYLDLTSWWQISNFAPDGRFVNLHALRPDEAGFDAAPWDMSRDMVLLDAEGRPQASARTIHDEPADKNTPAHWSMFQQGAARPVGPGRGASGPDDATYAPYSWADADGDGIYDSRWFELVDAHDPTQANPDLPRETISLLPRDNRWRWFVAARAIDLSSMINLNIAREIASGGAPTANNPIGQTPADTDVLRLLTLEDEFSLNPNSLGYGAIRQPPPPDAGVADYSDYSPTFTEAEEIGHSAYQGLKQTAKTGSPPPGGQELMLTPTPASEREDIHEDAGSALPGRARRDGQSLVNTAPFGLADLVELLTYHGLNDPDTLSRLEEALGGRAADPRYSPLRDNRPLDIERLADEDGDGLLDRERLALLAMDPRRRLTTLSGATQRRSSVVPFDPAIPGDLPSAIADIHFDEAPERISPQEALQLAAPPSVIIGTSTPTPADARPLFRAYASALLPSFAELDFLIAGGATPWQDDDWQTMFYGYDPLFALRAAAHLTVNRIDSWDEDQNPDPALRQEAPTAMTLLINRDARGSGELADPTVFPWWNVPPTTTAFGDIYPGRLDLERDLDGDGSPDELLLPTGIAPTAVNIYGIEPQPFLTQAATFFMYTDTPYSQGGDGPGSEWFEGDPTGSGLSTATAGKATIRGNAVESNEDFIFQILAFQVTNPFDTQLSLEDYEIEFGGKRYNLNDIGGGVITLAPRQTRLLYYLSSEKEDIAQRMNDAALASVSEVDPFMVEDVDAWINYQFLKASLGPAGGDPTAVELERLPAVGIGGAGGGIAGNLDLLAGFPAALDEPDNRAVLLWRTLDVPGGDTHDMLADRLRDPAEENLRPTLDRRLPGGQNEIDGTVVAFEGDDDDSGFSMTLWGSIRRPEDPKADSAAPPPSGNIPTGGVAAYLIESRFGNGGPPGADNFLNIAETDDMQAASLQRSDFAGSELTGEEREDNAEKRLDSLMQNQTGDPTAIAADRIVLIENIKLEPWAKKDPMDPLLALSPADHVTGLYTYWATDPTVPGLDPELHVGPQRGEPLRLADMLMAMAVGPVEDPNDPAFVLSVTEGAPRPEEKWTTLSEMLALALGYDEVDGAGAGGTGVGTAGGGVSTLDVGPPAHLWLKTDRGFLRLDDYTPFIDGNTDGVYDAAEPTDIIRGDGIPMGLGVLSAFRPFDEEHFGSLTQPSLGVVNINTAPISVLRALGLLSPTASNHQWLPASASHGYNSDIAATVLALRDKTILYPRQVPPISTPSPTDAISFVGTAARGVGDTDEGVVGGRAEHIANQRFLAGDPMAVREQPGFRSVGEIMLARDTAWAGSGIGGAGDGPLHDIDRLGIDANDIEDQGLESFTYDSAGVNQPDDLAQDYDEKLAIFNSVASSVAVRSDFYAVWFVLHGYQREDVEGLTDDDPLLPTIAKRFLIIVDRSNVTTEGERPRILHFQELPL